MIKLKIAPFAEVDILNKYVVKCKISCKINSSSSAFCYRLINTTG